MSVKSRLGRLAAGSAAGSDTTAAGAGLVDKSKVSLHAHSLISREGKLLLGGPDTEGDFGDDDGDFDFGSAPGGDNGHDGHCGGHRGGRGKQRGRSVFRLPHIAAVMALGGDVGVDNPATSHTLCTLYNLWCPLLELVAMHRVKAQVATLAMPGNGSAGGRYGGTGGAGGGSTSMGSSNSLVLPQGDPLSVGLLQCIPTPVLLSKDCQTIVAEGGAVGAAASGANTVSVYNGVYRLWQELQTDAGSEGGHQQPLHRDDSDSYGGNGAASGGDSGEDGDSVTLRLGYGFLQLHRVRHINKNNAGPAVGNFHHHGHHVEDGSGAAKEDNETGAGDHSGGDDGGGGGGGGGIDGVGASAGISELTMMAEATDAAMTLCRARASAVAVARQVLRMEQVSRPHIVYIT